MRPVVPIALAAVSVMTLAFAACTGGGSCEPDPIPAPTPTQTAAPPRDCEELGGVCRQDACDYRQGPCQGSVTVCQSTPRTRECGDGNAALPYDGPRCCVPAAFDDVGWMKLSFDPECGLSFAHGSAQLPAPVQWEPCSDELRARWPECSFIRVDWAPGEGPYAGRTMDEAQAASFDKQQRTTRLVVSRVTGPAVYRMIVRVADGKVEAALRETRPSCSLSHGDVRAYSSLFTVTRREGEKIVKTGALLVPREYMPYPGDTSDGVEPVHYLGNNGFFTTPTNVITSHEHVDGGRVPVRQTLPVQGALSNVVFRGDVVFFAGRDPERAKIEIFSSGGVRDFLAFGDDLTSGAADFGTDGRDMVWAEASGRTGAGEPWSSIDIFTAAYTKMPELIGPTIRKRRLRSETSFGGAPFIVGCEHAAHTVGTSGVRLVRLADGQSWLLFSPSSEPGTSWQITSPLAVTCDEVLVRLRRGDEHQVARIPFSSLGPGEAAD